MTKETQILLLDDLKERCNGKTRTMIRVLESFQGTSGTICSKLHSPDIASDFNQLGRTLHMIKGLLREIAAIGAADAVEGLENKLQQEHALSEEDLASVQNWVETANEAVEKAKDELRQN